MMLKGTVSESNLNCYVFVEKSILCAKITVSPKSLVLKLSFKYSTSVIFS